MGGGTRKKVSVDTLPRITSVPSTKKSLTVRGRTSAQRSGRVAVPACSMPTGNGFFENDPPELVARVALTILQKLVYETCSSDKLYLAFSAAKDRVALMEEKDQAMSIFNKLVLAADIVNKQHPMRSFYG